MTSTPTTHTPAALDRLLRPTTITLPEYHAWSGSDAWREHLLGDHGTNPVEGCPGCAVRPLLAVIHTVWNNCGDNVRMLAIWAESDGYGDPGFVPDQGYDWSGIRDSSPAATVRMFAAAVAP